MPDYGFLDKLLHRLALQPPLVAELSFDLDQRLVTPDCQAVANQQHVFITGLARSGTTALLRRLYASGAFRSLTYRDMPFVLAPNFWRRLAKVSRRRLEPAERAHGDRIVVDADSPESFDEVFWRVFAGAEYIAPRHLHPHEPDDETLDKFVRYVGAVLQARDGPAEDGIRYLSKNNNNVLRLSAIRRAFPRARLLVMFRDPMAQAASLLRQHRHFLSLHRANGFALSYMIWLAHHEFGRGHRPLHFEDNGWERVAAHRNESLDYWITLWVQTYRWLEKTAPDDAVFVCYEDLCNDPAVWPRLADLAGIDPEAGADTPFQSGNRGDSVAGNDALAEEAAALYDRLRTRARQYLA